MRDAYRFWQTERKNFELINPRLVPQPHGWQICHMAMGLEPSIYQAESHLNINTD